MNKLFFKKVLAAVSVMSMVPLLSILLSQTVFAAPDYLMNAPTIQVVAPLTLSISGSAQATPYVGNMNGQFVTIDWGDGTSDGDMAIVSDARFTTTYDKDNFYPAWAPITHVYASAGVKTVLIKVHHSLFALLRKL